MTTQSIIASTAVGVANKGNSVLSQNPVTLADATTAYVINVQLTNPATYVPDKTYELRVWYTTTMRTVTAANAVQTLGHTAHFVDIRPGRWASIVVSKDGAFEPKTGSKLHVWCDIPAATVALTLDVDVVECPS